MNSDKMFVKGFYRRYGKRTFDLFLALVGLAIATPFMLVAALLVLVSVGRPIFFRQVRAGLGGRPFVLLKFRTMTDKRNSSGQPLPDADRLHPLGSLLRASSLDELPELFNVVQGHMSLVGPRPLPVSYLQRYDQEQARRHEVRPGITGLAQVRGRNDLTWEERFRLDVWYVDHVSFRLDLWVLFLTVWKVLKMEGISHPGHATMEEFRGKEAREI